MLEAKGWLSNPTLITLIKISLPLLIVHRKAKYLFGSRRKKRDKNNTLIWKIETPLKKLP